MKRSTQTTFRPDPSYLKIFLNCFPRARNFFFVWKVSEKDAWAKKKSHTTEQSELQFF